MGSGSSTGRSWTRGASLGSLKTVSGDPDLYAWGPRNGFWPDRSANAALRPGDSEELATDSGGSGRYMIEVQAVGASEYEPVLAR